jgi:hypothetical protein
MEKSVYLVQPAEYVNTNVYKIGYTSNNNLSRVRSYGTKTKCIIIVACHEALKMESILLKEFNKIFTLHKGREYFSGDLIEMHHIFINILALNIVKTPTKQINENPPIQQINENPPIQQINKNPTNNNSHKPLIKNSNGIYECQMCNYCSEVKFNFQKHLNSDKHYKKQNNIKKKYNCVICNLNFNNNVSLWRHKQKCNKQDSKENKKMQQLTTEQLSMRQQNDFQTMHLNQQKQTNDTLVELITYLKNK